MVIGGLSWLQSHRHCCHGNMCCNCVAIVRGCNCIDTVVIQICVAIVLQLYGSVVVVIVLQFIMNVFAIVLTLLSLKDMLQFF